MTETPATTPTISKLAHLVRLVEMAGDDYMTAVFELEDPMEGRLVTIDLNPTETELLNTEADVVGRVFHIEVTGTPALPGDAVGSLPVEPQTGNRFRIARRIVATPDSST